MPENPLQTIVRDWLPEIDFGVMSHGFAPHGRDYNFIIEAGGTYELTLTHVVDLHVETRVPDEVWPLSWDDVLTDYPAWEAAGHPEGYVWGNNWSLAYPGLDAPDEHQSAQHWSKRLRKPMFAASIETDRFRLSAVFHNARSRKLSDQAPTIGKVLIPL
ncbi:hypothetical protein [Caulobacter sp. NIBR1757]|uniref:YxiG-like protein n=1 Tax=Caulobacter sp. NIBR1757 TaxID=3016000 RepID=UPI0022F09D8B|nr:hypothetical protein [Caulobacter sp. NIBR1757]